MAAYSIAHITVVDPEGFQKYSELAGSAITAHGGTFLFAGAPAAVEGSWPDGRLIAVVEFSTIEQLQAWYASPEYAEAKEIARNAFERDLLFLDSPAW